VHGHGNSKAVPKMRFIVRNTYETKFLTQREKGEKKLLPAQSKSLKMMGYKEYHRKKFFPK